MRTPWITSDVFQARAAGIDIGSSVSSNQNIQIPPFAEAFIFYIFWPPCRWTNGMYFPMYFLFYGFWKNFKILSFILWVYLNILYRFTQQQLTMQRGLICKASPHTQKHPKMHRVISNQPTSKFTGKLPNWLTREPERHLRGLSIPGGPLSPHHPTLRVPMPGAPASGDSRLRLPPPFSCLPCAVPLWAGVAPHLFWH